MRQVIAVAAGFILWSVGWLCYNASLRKFGLVSTDQTQPIHSVMALLALLAGSCILSLLAGFTAASIARSSPVAVAMGLGLLLLAVGLFFQIQLWRLMPFWYHLLFLVLLVPICFVGAWLRNAMT
jgi:hypothetical protein